MANRPSTPAVTPLIVGLLAAAPALAVSDLGAVIVSAPSVVVVGSPWEVTWGAENVGDQIWSTGGLAELYLSSQPFLGSILFETPLASETLPVVPLWQPGTTQVQNWLSVQGAQIWLRTVSFYVNDRWTVNNRLSFNLGARYERHSADTTQAGIATPNSSALVPRLGVTFDPKGDGRTSIHAAYGIFYDNQIIAIPQIGAGINGASDGVRTLVLRFPASIAPWRAPGHKIAEPTTPYPSLVISPDPGIETPYAHQVAVGVDHSLGRDFSVMANFAYVRGHQQLGAVAGQAARQAARGHLTGARPEDPSQAMVSRRPSARERGR